MIKVFKFHFDLNASQIEEVINDWIFHEDPDILNFTTIKTNDGILYSFVWKRFV